MSINSNEGRLTEMDMIDRHTDIELYRSLLAESAKALNELRCAKQDIEKAISRETFVILMMYKLIERKLNGD